jgi:WD40 repeat protein
VDLHGLYWSCGWQNGHVFRSVGLWWFVLGDARDVSFTWQSIAPTCSDPSSLNPYHTPHFAHMECLPGASLTTHFEPLHKLRAHSTYILKCLISPDCQQLATTSADKTVKLWNLQDGFMLDRTLIGHSKCGATPPPGSWLCVLPTPQPPR